MPHDLRAESELNFPMPSTARLAMHVDQLHREGTKVTPTLLAKHFRLDETVIRNILRRAEFLQLLRNDPDRGWIPVSQ